MPGRATVKDRTWDLHILQGRLLLPTYSVTGASRPSFSLQRGENGCQNNDNQKLLPQGHTVCSNKEQTLTLLYVRTHRTQAQCTDSFTLLLILRALINVLHKILKEVGYTQQQTGTSDDVSNRRSTRSGRQGRLGFAQLAFCWALKGGTQISSAFRFSLRTG